MYKVLVIDDSAIVRSVLSKIINSDPGLEVIDTAADPYIAARKIKKEVPDVITLDIEMPKMDGVTFLKKLMAQLPLPVVVISSITAEGSETAMKALAYGAVEIINKPKAYDKEFFEEQQIAICDKIKAAAISNTKRKKSPPVTVPPPKHSADAVISGSSIKHQSLTRTSDKIIVIGASTGGTEAIATILKQLPADSPGVVIVQHMPEFFTKSFAERLDSLCKLNIKEASDGDTVLTGHGLVAPGDKHLLLNRSGTKHFVQVKSGVLVNRHRPSVDVFFRSVAKNAGKNAIGVILTGMGADGAKGILELHQAGAQTIAQDEESSVVFGMPKEAIKLNAIDKVLPLSQIGSGILEMRK